MTRHGRGQARAVQAVTGAQGWQSKFERLVPPASNLRLAGLTVTLRLQVGSDPALIHRGAEGWFCTWGWGRGRDRSFSADALGEANEAIARLAGRS